MSIVYLRTPTIYPEEQKTITKTSRRKHKCSSGEILIAKILDALGLKYTKEFSIPTLPKLRFDFCVEPKILVEYDSKLHMQFNKYIHKTEKKFLKAQQRDALKTLEAVKEGYLIIRIDESLFSKESFVSNYIKTEIQNWKGSGIFVTPNPHLYEYLKNTIDPKIISKYKKKCI